MFDTRNELLLDLNNVYCFPWSYCEYLPFKSLAYAKFTLNLLLHGKVFYFMTKSVFSSMPNFSDDLLLASDTSYHKICPSIVHGRFIFYAPDAVVKRQ